MVLHLRTACPFGSQGVLPLFSYHPPTGRFISISFFPRMEDARHLSVDDRAERNGAAQEELRPRPGRDSLGAELLSPPMLDTDVQLEVCV